MFCCCFPILGFFDVGDSMEMFAKKPRRFQYIKIERTFLVYKLYEAYLLTLKGTIAHNRSDLKMHLKANDFILKELKILTITICCVVGPSINPTQHRVEPLGFVINS